MVEEQKAAIETTTYLIKDYWCYGCGLVGNTSMVCPICGSAMNYKVITLDLSAEPNRDLLMQLYEGLSLFVHRQNGQLALRKRSIGPVESEADDA